MSSDESTERAEDAAAGQVATSGLIEKFGGIRPMAAKLGIAVSTVQGWKQRDAIPAQRLAAIRAAAVEHDIDLGGADTAMAEPSPQEPPPQEPRRPPASAPTLSAPAPSAPTPSAPRPPTPSAPRPPARTSAQGLREYLILGATVSAFAFALLAVGLAWWSDGSGDGAGRVAALEARLTAIQTAAPPAADGALAIRMQEIEARLDERQAGADPALVPRIQAAEAAAASTTERMVALAAELERLATVVGRLEARPAPGLAAAGEAVAALTGEVEALGARLAELSGTAQQTDARTARALALALAAGQLRAAVAANRPFGEELAAVRQIAQHAPELAASLAALEPRAAEGIPDLVELQVRFPAVARAIVQAGRADAGGDWADRLLAQMSSIVSWRRMGLAGDTVDAVVARAEDRLGRGDVAGAVAQLQALAGPPTEAATEWLAAARARLAAEAAVKQLDARAREGLAAAPAG